MLRSKSLLFLLISATKTFTAFTFTSRYFTSHQALVKETMVSVLLEASSRHLSITLKHASDQKTFHMRTSSLQKKTSSTKLREERSRL